MVGLQHELQGVFTWDPRQYNWTESFFRQHLHYTKFEYNVSDFRDISASIIQGSGIWPVSYVVTASGLHLVNSGNLMSKYADDTYLIIPASNANTCTAEVEHRRMV